MNYNLLEEKWIPVLWKDGNISSVGIIEALTQAGRIRQIAASTPMDRVAVLRFLLALLYWCKGSPPDNITNDSFPADWFQKLHDNRDCFNILGKGKRFYQCMPDTDNKLSVNYLIEEIPTGIIFWHFKHATEWKDGLCLACCVMGLLRLPLFATSGGRGKPPGINAKPPIYVIQLGSSLEETLLLSWRKVLGSNLGTPAWEKPDTQLPKKGEVPLLTGLTWLPRRVWLDNLEGPEANCISCGRKEHLIRQCVFAGIGSTKTEGDGQGRVWNDPHVIYDSKDVLKPSNVLGSPDAAASQWAEIMGGILRGQGDDWKSKLWVVGFSTVQNDKYLEAMECQITLPMAPDNQKHRECIEKIERWEKEGRGLGRKIGRSKVEGSTAIAFIRPHVEAEVSNRVGELVSGDDSAWEQAAGEYSPMMAVIARSLSPGYTTAAVQRRKHIAGIKATMQPHTTASKKA